METLATWLLAISLTWPVPWSDRDEPWGDRHKRLETVAGAVASEVDRAVMTGRLPGERRHLWAAVAWAVVMRESGGLARAVHSGQRKGDGGRSTCYAQINRGNPGAFPQEGWGALAGLSERASRRCAWALVESLVRGRDFCRRRGVTGLPTAAVNVYLNGSRCDGHPEARRRAAAAYAWVRQWQHSRGAPTSSDAHRFGLRR